ncbi:hypothetical protein N431DRAFT_484476 [Stipitochalara longipes BDJ]|nr:hypothetical protein N431DRAFT_484476 [Stipitochalara longipes BDJ]
MKNRRLISVIVLFVYARVSLQATSCYFPDGTFAENDSPCFPDQAESICCGQGHTCMSNNLCRWPASQMPYPLAYIRGSCTDSSWNSTECNDVCKTVFPSEWDPIVACPGAQFCCELDSDDPSSCCNLTNTTAHPLYELAAASTVTVIGSSATSSTAVSVSPATATSTFGSANSNNDNGSSGGSSGSGAKIGIGVGVGGGALLVVAGIALFFFRRRKGAKETHPELDHTEVHGQDKGIQKSELPGMAEQNYMPLDTKGAHAIVTPELGADERLPEMP